MGFIESDVICDETLFLRVISVFRENAMSALLVTIFQNSVVASAYFVLVDAWATIPAD